MATAWLRLVQFIWSVRPLPELIALHGNDGSSIFHQRLSARLQSRGRSLRSLLSAFGAATSMAMVPEIIAVDGFDGSNPANDIFRRQLIASITTAA